jgi:NAD(P)-dependent dehydrogenase (short-subunit alcohol dehydrogenase family)
VEAVLASGERVLATLRKPEVLAYLKDKYTPEQLLIQQLDVVNDEQIEAAFAAAKEHFGRLDVVVNNAGYGLFGEAEGIPPDEARKQVEVLFWGPVNISLKVRLVHTQRLTMINTIPRPLSSSEKMVPRIRANISSTLAPAGGYNAVPCLAFYCSAKFGESPRSRHAIRRAV